MASSQNIITVNGNPTDVDAVLGNIKAYTEKFINESNSIDEVYSKFDQNLVLFNNIYDSLIKRKDYHDLMSVLKNIIDYGKIKIKNDDHDKNLQYTLLLHHLRIKSSKQLPPSVKPMPAGPSATIRPPTTAAATRPTLLSGSPSSPPRRHQAIHSGTLLPRPPPPPPPSPSTTTRHASTVPPPHRPVGPPPHARFQSGSEYFAEPRSTVGPTTVKPLVSATTVRPLVRSTTTVKPLTTVKPMQQMQYAPVQIQQQQPPQPQRIVQKVQVVTHEQIYTHLEQMVKTFMKGTTKDKCDANIKSGTKYVNNYCYVVRKLFELKDSDICTRKKHIFSRFSNNSDYVVCMNTMLLNVQKHIKDDSITDDIAYHCACMYIAKNNLEVNILWNLLMIVHKIELYNESYNKTYKFISDLIDNIEKLQNIVYTTHKKICNFN